MGCPQRRSVPFPDPTPESHTTVSNFPPVEEAVARLATELTFDAIPAEALAGARRLMQDQLSLQVGSAALPWSQAVLELTRAAHLPGAAHVVASGDAMSAADAAFVNATFGHGFEYDDAHRASSSSSSVLSEESATALLRAITAGDLDQPVTEFAALLRV